MLRNEIISILAIFLVPLVVHAQVEIVRIVSDPPGGDTGREWVEIMNRGTTSILLASWRFVTGGVNHRIVALSGIATIAPGASAVIVQDAAKFASDTPSFTGALFHASFSLTNAGGTVALRDASGTVVVSRSYSNPPPIHEVKAKSTKARAQTSSNSPVENVLPDTEGANVAAPGAAADTISAQVASVAGSHISLWATCVVLLAAAAAAGIFLSRRAKSREWDIIEETPEDT